MNHKNKRVYWAIPKGLFNHRDGNAQSRIHKYLTFPDDDIHSCYYHTGRTTNKSIFFISDTVPIIDKYIDLEHLDINRNHFVIKNKPLVTELERKLFRILSIENSNNNYFGQHITDIKNYLIDELIFQNIFDEVAFSKENEK